MLYNLKEQKKQSIDQCFNCQYWNKQKKQCNGGLDKRCFIYDEKTQTIFDSKTGLAIRK